MTTAQWARLLPAQPGHLRRGAWYRVVRLTAVPRPSLEILPARPIRWTVVPRPSRAARLPASWGPCYGVCPNCRERARLEERTASMRCPKCNGYFDIGWDHS